MFVKKDRDPLRWKGGFKAPSKHVPSLWADPCGLLLALDLSSYAGARLSGSTP